MEITNRFATSEECDRFSRFLDWLAMRGRRPSTARSYRSDWQDLAIWYRRYGGEAFDGSYLTADLVGAWREDSEKKGRSASTVLRRMAFARSYVGWLRREMALDEDTVTSIREAVRLKRTQRGTRILELEDLHRFLAHVDARGCLRDQAIVYVLIDSGIRVSELVDLDVGDVDFGNGELSIKGGRERSVPLPTRAARKLAWSLGERGLLELPEDGEIVLPATGGWPPKALVSPPDPMSLPRMRTVPNSPMPFGSTGSPADWPLFVGERGRLSVNGVQRVIRKHATFARLEVTPQLLRHTFAFGHWAKTQDLVGLAETLGLESVESARIYTRLDEATEQALRDDKIKALA